MPCVIQFVGDDDNYIKAEQDTDEVVGLWRTAGGEPFEVTLKGRRSFISPAHIAAVRDIAKPGKMVSF